MDTISIFFIILSILTIYYLIYILKIGNRIPVLIEFFGILIYLFIILLFLFPNILNLIQNLLKINSAINFIIYLSIFISYLFLLILYKKSEEQRIEITTLVREISYLKYDKKNTKKK